ncbi:hypothetical protein ANCDUO_08676 [Ancylostoma duodenale]|uniref:Uncharacterized protein n=1 Tax=Ancylostoma duodenale TaxID=51022 RepID=A0A0C2DF46_9BILA|nr:hypothetical protein ANCDUO_08676 [Ancylostoma duodenale]
MYCAQWLIPVLLIPKHWLHPLFLVEQALFMWFYIIAFFLEHPATYVRPYSSLHWVCSVGLTLTPAFFGLPVIANSMERYSEDHQITDGNPNTET